MSLKMEFVEKAAAAGANVAALCREFGISRETGYKWLGRFKASGYDGLEERSRRPVSSPSATAEELVLAVLEAREAHPRFGPKKLFLLLEKRYGRATPSRATIARLLKRFGVVRKRRRRPALSVVEQAPCVEALAPNDVWSVDFKGSWRSTSGEKCEPFTVRDAFSRFVLCAKLLARPTVAQVRAEMERLMRRHGVPGAIQCDNGAPFICTQSRGGLTKLSAWWVSLGMTIVRSRGGCPQDNGGHERMHGEIAADVEAEPLGERAHVQRALDRWRQDFNHVRPHEALLGKTPAEVYLPSTRRSLRAVPALYPPTWTVKRVEKLSGRVYVHGEYIRVGRALAGHTIAFEPLTERSVRIWFHKLDLGELQIPPHPTIVEAACERFIRDRRRRPKVA